MNGIIDEARRWLGTPFAHQGRARGIGCDCAGLIGGVATSLGFVPQQWWSETFDPIFGGYAPTPSRDMLSTACASFMDRVRDAPRSGDVLLMRFAREPQHLAFYVLEGDSETMIHAYTVPGKVVEHRLNHAWRARIVATFRFKVAGA